MILANIKCWLCKTTKEINILPLFLGEIDLRNDSIVDLQSFFRSYGFYYRYKIENIGCMTLCQECVDGIDKISNKNNLEKYQTIKEYMLLRQGDRV